MVDEVVPVAEAEVVVSAPELLASVMAAAEADRDLADIPAVGGLIIISYEIIISNWPPVLDW